MQRVNRPTRQELQSLIEDLNITPQLSARNSRTVRRACIAIISYFRGYYLTLTANEIH